jgi:hypothetical protein
VSRGHDIQSAQASSHAIDDFQEYAHHQGHGGANDEDGQRAYYDEKQEQECILNQGAGLRSAIKGIVTALSPR